MNKSIGKVIAILRKSRGMTQQQLADLLHVSNKAVSRWERDECTPDVLLIPVIADLFQISSDELLRGELDQKSIYDSDKRESEEIPINHFEFLIESQLVNAKNQAILSIGLVVLGIISMLVSGYGFYQPILGFGMAVSFFLGSIIIQTISSSKLLAGFFSDKINKIKLSDYRYRLVNLFSWILFLNILAIWIISPLVIIRESSLPRSILSAKDWVRTFPGSIMIAYVVIILASLGIDHWVMKNKLFQDSHEVQVRIKEKLKQKMYFCKRGFVLLIITFGFHTVISEILDPVYLSQTLSFDSFEEFRTFAETPSQPDQQTSQINVEQHRSNNQESTTFDGRLRLTDPNNQSNVFFKRNQTIAIIRWETPIEVITNIALAKGQAIYDVILLLLNLAYFVIVISATLGYWKSRKRVSLKHLRA